MQTKLGFRNNMDSSRFNFRVPFRISQYKEYIAALKESGAIEIEHVGKNLRVSKQRQRVKDSIQVIHDLEMKAILYTGIFGSIDVRNSGELKKMVQRDLFENVLSYGKKGKGTAMMCPSSDYVEKVVLPQINKTLKFAAYDGIFLDIPWIMYGGCFCDNCHDVREENNSEGKNQAETNAANVKQGLERFVSAIKKDHPDLKISVNVSAPTVYRHSYHGAEIENLAGLFDQYVTEWNPLRVNQQVSVVTKCVKKAIEVVEETETVEEIQKNPEFYHATTCTNLSGKIYPAEKLSRLFYAILNGGALPRLGIAFPSQQLEVIKEAWESAVEKYQK
jgi:hypothetical protein